MSARILIVDDIPANIRVLEARLTAEYYDVVSATRGAEVQESARRGKPDIILLDVMMPDMDGFEVCRRLKADPDTRHIPVVMITALAAREARIEGLQAGAEDFLTKPIDDVQLIARVRSLVRLKGVIDELRAREASGRRMGVIDADESNRASLFTAPVGGTVLAVDDNPRQLQRVQRALSGRFEIKGLGDEQGASPDLAIVAAVGARFDGLKVIARMASAEATRHLPILAIVDVEDRKRALRALELGAQDIIGAPVDEEELAARAQTLVRRRRYMEALRATLDHGMEMAVTDQLTGLFNRRFLSGQLEPLVQRAAFGGEPVSIFIADIDHFKKVNDRFGHDAGDRVLKEFALRLASAMRPSDFACRMGGEEFLVIMPNAAGETAALAAERVRRQVAGAPFSLDSERRLEVTVSIGVASSSREDRDAETLIKRADEALYKAKAQGRNRVVGAEAQAAHMGAASAI